MKFPPQLFQHLSHRDELGGFLTSLGLTGKAVEVGTFHGAYATKLLETWPGHLYCVDPWRNQPEEVYRDGVNLVNLDAVWSEVQGSLGQHPRCTLMRMFSTEAAIQFEDHSLDCVFLDGNHRLEAVRDDIFHWWNKVKIGGIFCGHDYYCRHDKDTDSDALTAVLELVERIDVHVHVTWCNSWYVAKDQAADDRYHGLNREW